jgi:hypothetical protein
MKHAGPVALEQLTGLIIKIRELPGLAERGTGIFYRKGTAFLHFHEDIKGIFADVKIAGVWERFPVTRPAEISAFLARVRSALN